MRFPFFFFGHLSAFAMQSASSRTLPFAPNALMWFAPAAPSTP